MGTTAIGSLGIPTNGAIFDMTGSYYPALAFIGCCVVLALVFVLIGMARPRKVGFDTAEDAQMEAQAGALKTA